MPLGIKSPKDLIRSDGTIFGLYSYLLTTNCPDGTKQTLVCYEEGRITPLVNDLKFQTCLQ